MPASLSTASILEVFSKEIIAQGGSVASTFDDGTRLFTRALLPHMEEVLPRDRVKGGVALKSSEYGVSLHPYTFRLVCRNGAIVAEALETQHLENLEIHTPDIALEMIQETVQTCCNREVFANLVKRMRAAAKVPSSASTLMSMVLSHPVVHLIPQIMAEFFRERDQTMYGLAQAITAVARETPDPELRWELEELGGAVATGNLPRKPTWESATYHPEEVLAATA